MRFTLTLAVLWAGAFAHLALAQSTENYPIPAPFQAQEAKVSPQTAPVPAAANTGASSPDAAQAQVGGSGELGLKPLQTQSAGGLGVAAMLAPVDLWDRMRRGFAMPDLQSDLVRGRETWYATRPDYIERMTDRSRKYLFHVVEELERRNMPTELALLPFIESAFNPQAVSSAKAAGMWQFIPSTGKYFDLKQNVFRDDRRDVLASTRAALDYLSKLHGMFGDWHLALAAYNWGEGSVGRAIAKNQKAGRPIGYLDLSMPNETRDYIPKLQAVKNIVANPQAFNARLPNIENHPYFQSVTITRDIDVSRAASMAEVKLDDFKALNPSANKPVILAAGTPQILLPWDNAETFQSNLAKANGQLASWTAWVVPSNMRPLEAAKRVGMSEANLREVNRIPPNHSIRAGSTLLVPRGSQTEDVGARVADSAQLALAADPVRVCRTAKVKGKSKQVCKMVQARSAKDGNAKVNVKKANRTKSKGQPAKAAKRKSSKR